MPPPRVAATDHARWVRFLGVVPEIERCDNDRHDQGENCIVRPIHR